MTGATRQNIFRLKRSNVSGKLPTISQLLVGEMAVNTQDGFLYTSIADSGGTTTVDVRQIGWDRLSTISGGTVSGSVTFNSGITVYQSFKYVDGNQLNTKVLTTDDNGNASWQFPTLAGNLAFFFKNEISNLSTGTTSGVTYLQSTLNPQLGSIQTLSSIGVINNQLLNVFISPSGGTGINFIPTGIVTLHIHAAVTNSNPKPTQLYFKLYRRDSGGTETLLGTSNNTTTISGVQGEYTTDIGLIATTGQTTDRIVVKIYASVGAGGPDPNIDLYIEDATLSRIQLPSSAINTSNFVPYVGARGSVNLGGYDITATNFYGNGSNLTGINDYYVTGGTYSNGIITLNRGNGSFTVSGLMSADTFVTGFTYNNANLLSISQNNGQPNLNITLNIFTGLTVNGIMTATTVNPGVIYVGSTTGGTIQANRELVLQQVGDTFGSSILRLRNRNGENGAIYETTDPTITLVDFIFKTALNQRNIRYEARTGSSFLSAPEFQFGQAANPSLVVNDTTVLMRGSGGTITTILSASTTSTNSLTVRNNPISGYILTSDVDGNATWQPSPLMGSGSTKLDYQSVTGNTTVTSTNNSSTWVDIGSMTITARNLTTSATTYTFNFSCSAALSANAGIGNIRVVANGNPIAGTNRQRTNISQINGLFAPITTNGYITGVKSGDIIKVQFNSPTGRWTVTDRAFTIMGILNSNIV